MITKTFSICPLLDQVDPSPGQEVVFPFEVTSQDSSAQKPIVELNETRNINTRCRGKETSSNSIRNVKTRPIFVLQLDLVLINIQSRLEFEKTKLDKSEGLGDKPICSSTL